MRLKDIVLCFAISLFTEVKLNAQCSPPWTDHCKDAHILCSPSELHGYCCSHIKYSNPSGCDPLCPSGGKSINTSWWAFKSLGGSVMIHIEVNNCSINGMGIQMGLWADCSCNESVICRSECKSSGMVSITADLDPCKDYYFFVNGCNGDICDICILIEEEREDIFPPPSLNGPQNVCLGTNAQIYYLVSEYPCVDSYEWFLNGDNLFQDADSVGIHFVDVGDFVLCGTGFHYSNSRSICYQIGPVCKNILVSKQADVNHGETICFETAGNYKPRANCFWAQNGRLICRGEDSAACIVDTNIFFIVLSPAVPPEIYYLAAFPGEFYKDTLTGLTFRGCQFETEIHLPKSAGILQCDSSYVLNMFSPDYTANLRNYGFLGSYYLEARLIDRTQTCGNSGYSETIQFKWYRKADPQKKTLDTNEIIKVFGHDTFCVDIFIHIKFGNTSRDYAYTFCQKNTKGPKIIGPEIPPTDTMLGRLNSNILKQELENEMSFPSKNKNTINIIPNPNQSGNKFSVIASKSIGEMFIYDLNAKLVWSGNAHQEKSLDLFLDSNLAPGVYIMMANCNKKLIFERFVVQP
ncbi:MAG: T9SS type A sorting domain-containing protein [Saprospiraceae bacterium]|nr:T9SS type A sorting domain-containing protein [Saprospiraceae bacterium]